MSTALERWLALEHLQLPAVCLQLCVDPGSLPLATGRQYTSQGSRDLFGFGQWVLIDLHCRVNGSLVLHTTGMTHLS